MATPEPDPTFPGRYLTDGRRLLRIVAAQGRPPHGGVIELEDCRSLEVIVVLVECLGRLRRVRPSTEPVAVAA